MAMSTSSVKVGLDSASNYISTERAALQAAKARISDAVTNLASIPSLYAAIVTEINGYTPTGTFETLCQDELAKLITEYQALRTAALAAEAALAVIDFDA